MDWWRRTHRFGATRGNRSWCRNPGRRCCRGTAALVEGDGGVNAGGGALVQGGGGGGGFHTPPRLRPYPPAAGARNLSRTRPCPGSAPPTSPRRCARDYDRPAAPSLPPTASAISQTRRAARSSIRACATTTASSSAAARCLSCRRRRGRCGLREALCATASSDAVGCLSRRRRRGSRAGACSPPCRSRRLSSPQERCMFGIFVPMS